MMLITRPHSRDKIEAQAAQWAIHLSGSALDAAQRAELDAWLAQDPAHGKAMAEAMATWANLSALRREPGNLVRHSRATRLPPRPWTHVAAIAACLLLALLTGLSWFSDPWLAFKADYRTGPGEMRTLTLEDGSRVDLAPESSLAVRFDERERRVELLAGRAFFAPTPAEQVNGRPFVVAAAGGTAQALGTRFMVDRADSDTVSVTVTEHSVRVTAPLGGSATLSPGETISYGPRESLGTVRAADIRRATAWLDGKLIFDRVPLSEVVAELNRYRRGRILVLSDDLAARTVSGVFDAGRLGDALDSIADELAARHATVPPFLTLLY